MNFSRRDLNILLPAMLAAVDTAKGDSKVLPSKCYSYDSLAPKTNPQTKNVARAVFNGETHDGTTIEMHITTLQPGQSPHPPHQHLHEEMFMIQRGVLEATIAGQTCTLGMGSVAYVHSNDLHGVRNTGDLPTEYFVVEIGNQKT